jgi:thiamine pyrophosphate-dependent acetolactate synthase large subunit-like protein
VQRGDVVDAVIAERDDATVVVSVGASSGLVSAKDPHPATIYNMVLGYATAFAYGIALARPDRRTIVIDGDGSMFAGIQALGTLARFPVDNLTVVVVANGIWGTGDGNIATTPGSAEQLAAIARACGHPGDRVFVTAEAAELRALLARAKREPGPWIACAVTERSSTDRSGARPRVQLDSLEAADLTRRYLRSGTPPGPLTASNA